MKKRILRIWFNRQGKIRREILPKSYPATAHDSDLLEEGEPTSANCNKWLERGFMLSNWHVIEQP